MSANLLSSKNSDVDAYCICKSMDDSRFMICCDSCNKWFHGDCVNVKADQAKKIKQFYCPPCRTEKNLSIVYKQKAAATDSDAEPAKKRQKKECGNCIGCFRTEDCGRCDICKENKNEFNQQSRKLKCRLRQCVNATSVEKPTQKKRVSVENRKNKSTTGDSGGVKLKNVSKKKPAAAPATPPEFLVRSAGAAGGKNVKAAFPAGTTRASARAYKDFMIEAGLLSDEDNEEVRQCFGPGCILPARPGSKYCSDETCGMKLARARLAEILPGRIQQWNSSPSITEEFERKRLEAIETQMETARQKLANCVADDEKLSTWLNGAKSVKASVDGAVEENDDAELFIFCTTCGHEINAKTALRHIARCFSKYESQTSYGSVHRTYNNIYNIFCDAFNKTSRTYCKRLRVICPEHYKEPKIDDDDICAAPLSTDTPLDRFDENLACSTSKKACMKHYKWDKIRRAMIDMERLSQLLKLDELFEEQKALKAAIAARGGVLQLMLHQTVKHDDGVVVVDIK